MSDESTPQGPVTGHDVEDPRGEICFPKKSCKRQGRKWRLFSRLEHHGVAGRKGCRQLGSVDSERIVHGVITAATPIGCLSVKLRWAGTPRMTADRRRRPMSAKKSNHSTARSTSALHSMIGFPTSRASIRANSSRRDTSRPAARRNRRARSDGAIADQPASNAWSAAPTAEPTSGALPYATSASHSPVAGLKVAIVVPSDDSRNELSMNACLRHLGDQTGIPSRPKSLPSSPASTTSRSEIALRGTIPTHPPAVVRQLGHHTWTI